MRPSRFVFTTAPLALALLAAPMIVAPLAPAHAQFGIGVSITIAPPALPIYVQPPLPAPGYLWTPGFWNYGEAGYYWVPGTWVQPPSVGLLWTPGYWGFNNGIYAFNRGYWGPHVGFYGGINYGFGYGGIGFEGGEWRGGAFAYNSAVNNFGGVHVTNVYNRTVINNTTINRTSFNGPNGVAARPSPQEAAFAREQHVQPTALQEQHDRAAAQNPALRASTNHGNPAIAATSRPGEFHGGGVVPARAEGSALHPAEAARPGEAARATAGATPARMNHVAAAHSPGAVRASAHPAYRSPGAGQHIGGMGRPMGRPMGMGGAPHMAGPRPAMQAPHAAAAPHGGGERPGPKGR